MDTVMGVFAVIAIVIGFVGTVTFVVFVVWCCNQGVSCPMCGQDVTYSVAWNNEDRKSTTPICPDCRATNKKKLIS